jgi:hypothetical protein
MYCVTRPVITIRQRRTDLFVALIFQALSLVAVNELLRSGDYSMPAMAIAGSVFVTSALATIYVLVISEFKPVAFETSAFALWVVTNAAFGITIWSPAKVKVTELPQEERPRPAVVIPHYAPRSSVPMMPTIEPLAPEVEKINKAWPALPEEKRKAIIDQVDQTLQEQNLPIK